MSIAIGIDLGTSNSVVSAVLDGRPQVLLDAEGRGVHPSVVAFGFAHSVVVGHAARQQLTYAPENTVYSVKRLIGRRFNSTEVEHLRSMVGWGIAEGPHGDARVRVQGKVFAAQEVSANILVHMKKIAEESTGQSISGAVITVPAYFNDQQRKATRDAAEIAGMECLRIINEPTAAALAYGHGRGKQQHIAVYDLGGGTFDMSILRLDDDVFEVVSTAGDTFLGGNDFDVVIAKHLEKVLQRTTGMDGPPNHATRLALMNGAEQAKIALSHHPAVDVRIPNLGRDKAGLPIQLETRLERRQVETLVAPLIERTFKVCEDALHEAGLTVQQIDKVLMVGGMTRAPFIHDGVGGFFHQKPDAQVNPDEVVALGAAIHAHNLTTFSDKPGAILLDVTPQSLGIRTVGGFVENLIPRNSPIPTDASKVFHTAHDDQTQVRVQVFQGESRMANDNERLAEFVLDELRPAARGEVRIRITFSIDADGIVRVTAMDEETGKEVNVRIEASSNLIEEEIKEMRFDDLGF